MPPSCRKRGEKEKSRKKTQPQTSATNSCNSDKPPKSNVQTYTKFQTFEFKYCIIFIRATSSNQVWVSYFCELELLNDAGKTQKTMEMEVDITDFCVSPSASDIWFCSSKDNSVRKVIGDNKSKVKFHTESEPLTICISASGNIMIGMERQVVTYTQRGQILCKSTKVKRTPVVRYPRSISQCPVTRNIAVVDGDSKDYGGDDKPHVSIVSEDLQLLYRYYGRDIEPFSPCDVCYSDTGDIYVADFNSKSIQQISGSGEFVQTVYTDRDKSAMCLCVQSNGDIWAVFDRTSVIILQKQ